MNDSRASRHRVICRHREVPPGWVVIEVCHSQACDGDGDNALVIKKPGRREVVWLECKILDGYTETRQSHSHRFPGDGNNARTIERDDD